MKLCVLRVLVAGLASAAALPQALAQSEATGAGASFPAPLYAKWAETRQSCPTRFICNFLQGWVLPGVGEV